MSTPGDVDTCMMGAKSLTGSNGMFLYRLGFTAHVPTVAITIV